MYFSDACLRCQTDGKQEECIGELRMHKTMYFVQHYANFLLSLLFYFAHAFYNVMLYIFCFYLPLLCATYLVCFSIVNIKEQHYL